MWVFWFASVFKLYLTGELQPQICTTVSIQCAVFCLAYFKFNLNGCLKYARPLASKSKVVTPRNGYTHGHVQKWVWQGENVCSYSSFLYLQTKDFSNTREVHFLVENCTWTLTSNTLYRVSFTYAILHTFQVYYTFNEKTMVHLKSNPSGP